jgi:hypothetical protein
VAAMIDEVADALRGFDAAEIMWEFLESKRLPDPR